ncbi:MAG: hypothetical protein HUU03_01915 [Planctomycetaceae bacterium]|nr:hypothetical protein [Planctomycetota bacterium]NUO15179.1 hypothetical protein [Planctomycetaceae bacterium]HRJ77253.1 hypothetical protein [Planctomycetota bacterium]
MEILARISRRDPHRLLFAPLLGAAGGFLLNRARGGQVGAELALEMGLCSALLTLAVAAIAALCSLERERARSRARQLEAIEEAERRAAAREKLLLVEAEAQRCRAEMQLRENLMDTRNRLLQLEDVSNTADLRSQMLKRAVIELNGRFNAGNSQNLGEALARAASRIEALEARQQEVLEARERLAALEIAQEKLSLGAMALSETARREAEEVKASLKLAISDSQRQRNVEADEREESGRILELEARIKRLAREIERLSNRTAPVAEEGVASTVAPGGTNDQAKLGFFKALLDANKTLRKQIKAAA